MEELCKSLHFLLYNVGHPLCLSAVFLFVYVTKITKRTRNKINASPVLSWNRVFKAREFNFVNRFKEDFEKILKILKDVEELKRDER